MQEKTKVNERRVRNARPALPKAWARTRSIIAKSSGESKLFVVIRGSSEELGLVTLAGDFGADKRVRAHVDATAAKGMVERRGLSRVRHM